MFLFHSALGSLREDSVYEFVCGWSVCLGQSGVRHPGN